MLLVFMLCSYDLWWYMIIPTLLLLPLPSMQLRASTTEQGPGAPTPCPPCLAGSDVHAALGPYALVDMGAGAAAGEVEQAAAHLLRALAGQAKARGRLSVGVVTDSEGQTYRLGQLLHLKCAPSDSSSSCGEDGVEDGEEWARQTASRAWGSLGQGQLQMRVEVLSTVEQLQGGQVDVLLLLLCTPPSPMHGSNEQQPAMKVGPGLKSVLEASVHAGRSSVSEARLMTNKP